MRFNPMTSKTVIGAIIVAIGLIADSGVFGADNGPFIRSLGTLLEAVGGVVFAWGIRHAVAKASQGVAQMNPVATMLAILLSVPIVSLAKKLEPLPSPVVTLLPDEYFGAAGDSLRYIIEWTQPTDTAAKGPIDSTAYSFISSAGVTFYGATGVVPPGTKVRRKFGGARLTDSLKLAKPTTVGDSTTFQIAGFTQCRKGDCSIPGSLAWHYRETWAPPPAAPNVKGPVRF